MFRTKKEYFFVYKETKWKGIFLFSLSIQSIMGIEKAYIQTYLTTQNSPYGCWYEKLCWFPVPLPRKYYLVVCLSKNIRKIIILPINSTIMRKNNICNWCIIITPVTALTCVMINKVIVTMIDGNPNIPHKRTACRRIFNLTGSLDSEEFLSAMSGLFISSNWRLVTPVITHVLVYTRHSLYFRNYRAYWGKQNIIYMELFEMGRQTILRICID